MNKSPKNIINSANQHETKKDQKLNGGANSTKITLPFGDGSFSKISNTTNDA